MPFAPVRASLRVALVTGLVGAGIAIAPAAAYAQEGIRITGTAHYDVRDDGSPVEVTTTITFTNVQPSTATTYYYWSDYSLWLPTGVKGLRASSNGAPVMVTTKTDRGFDYANLAFPTRLLYGQSRTIEVTYTIPGGTFRSKDSARVGPGFASFEVYSPGDTGAATIDITAPRWMALTLNASYDSTEDGDLRTSTFRGGGDSGLWARMALRDESQKTTKTVTIGSDSFTIEAFPGDKAWLAHIAKALPGAVPALVKEAGAPWPDGKVTIQEDATNNVNGYDGRYNGGTITISERLEPALLYHELAHAWANYDHLQGRWLVEGLAGALTTRAAKALGTKDEGHLPVARKASNAFALADWPTGSRESTPNEAYGYPASWWVVDHLLSGSTKATTGELVDALVTRTSSYAIPGEAPLTAANSGWRQAYDLFAITGGNAKTDALMREWVIGKDDLGELTKRAAARKTYAAFDKSDGPWSPPRGVRVPMATWDFGAASRTMVDAASAAKAAAALANVAKPAGLAFATVRKSYESANSVAQYRSLTTQLTALSGATSEYREAADVLAEPSNLFERIGRPLASPAADVQAARSDLERGDAAAARSAIGAARAADHRSQTIGIAAAGGVAALVLLLGGFAGWRRRRGSRPHSEM